MHSRLVAPRIHFLLICLTCLLPCGSRAAADEFPPAVDPALLAQHVRNTEPLSPQEEQKQLFVPEGFQVELVASEPDIAKPMNLAFDDRGRLWVSHSREYPFAAPADRAGRDQISVIEDLDNDGLPESARVFADGLNIPIGLCPHEDGVICFSIPDILLLRDTDGDGTADSREVLYGPFDTTRDTHGMCNAFRRGHDGWIYACHGFNNHSTVAGRDGHEITMKSGNVFRFRPDGSRIEQFTFGQVNPFGMAIDQFGDIFTADCHTKPVTLLIQGGCYDSFGRPHDGLGYVPNVMDHLHGSTAIGGIALGEALAFPTDYRDSTFGGNVMTSRINRNQLVRQGGTVRAVEHTDFLVSGDPWFRPVDLVAGPDGALYVADFYNRIIGHYEVDLNHPARDRHRGRVWRVTAVDSDASVASNARSSRSDVRKLTLPQLIQRLGTQNSVVSQQVMDRIVDRFPNDAATSLSSMLTAAEPAMRWQALRILQRLNAVNVEQLERAAADREPVVRVHAFRALSEAAGTLFRNADDRSRLTALMSRGLLDSHGVVQRAAALAAGDHGDDALLPILIAAWHSAPPQDVHFRHTIRMSLRDLLIDTERFARSADIVDAPNVPLIAGLCPAIDSPQAAGFIVDHVDQLTADSSTDLPALLQFAAARAPSESAVRLITAIRRIHSTDSDRQLQLLTAMTARPSENPAEVSTAITDWVTQLTCDLLEIATPDDLTQLHVRPSMRWVYQPHAKNPNTTSCWGITHSRKSADGVPAAGLHSSFEAGETRSGTLRSESFPIPPVLTFYVAGHDGHPRAALQGNNLVRLRDAETLQVLKETSPPRNDVAQQVSWDLTEFADRRGIVELVDGDRGNAFAWLAVGRFSMEGLNPDGTLPRHRTATELIARHRLAGFEPALVQLLSQSRSDAVRVSMYAAALAGLRADIRLQALALVPSFSRQTPELSQQVIDAIVDSDGAQAELLLAASARTATLLEQQQLSETLAASRDGASVLLNLLDGGAVSMQVLYHAATRSKLLATLPESDVQLLADRLAQLPDEAQQLASAITHYHQAYLQSPGDPTRGREIFTKNCGVCHQIAGEGKRVGPNLDGIGNRGLERLIEDVLAPNRNVDAAFRSSTIVLTDGRTLTGLVREAPGGGLEIVDARGEVAAVQEDHIEERIDSLLSPMPSNVQQLLTEEQTHDLFAWLLQQRK